MIVEQSEVDEKSGQARSLNIPYKVIPTIFDSYEDAVDGMMKLYGSYLMNEGFDKNTGQMLIPRSNGGIYDPLFIATIVEVR